ncbi:MAG: spore coat protein [Desulfofundulus sp.]|uniref:spore coat protein n=1 Tax=Desulfofundulus sp. TaxID=2282750 RepID=UPI003C741452
MQFTDRDILADMLIGAKMISTGYHTAVLEAANDRVRNTLIQINNEEMSTQKQIFDLMHSRGWYPLDPVFTGTPMGPEATNIRGPEGTMGRMGPGMTPGMAPGMGPAQM